MCGLRALWARCVSSVCKVSCQARPVLMHIIRRTRERRNAASTHTHRARKRPDSVMSAHPRVPLVPRDDRFQTHITPPSPPFYSWYSTHGRRAGRRAGHEEVTSTPR